jgi:hypothetical protein
MSLLINPREPPLKLSSHPKACSLYYVSATLHTPTDTQNRVRPRPSPKQSFGLDDSPLGLRYYSVSRRLWTLQLQRQLRRHRAFVAFGRRCRGACYGHRSIKRSALIRRVTRRWIGRRGGFKSRRCTAPRLPMSSLGGPRISSAVSPLDSALLSRWK